MLADVIAYDFVTVVIALADVIAKFIVLYWFMRDVIAKDYDYGFFSQLADVIAFIVVDVNHI